MQKNRKTSAWAVGLLAAGMMGMLTGCQGNGYERLRAAQQETESAKGLKSEAEPVEIVIGQEKPEISKEEAENVRETPERAAEPSEEVSLLFAGDVLLSDHVLNAYQKSGGIHGVVDDGYRREISEADFFMVNQEFPFSGRGVKAPDKQYTFRLPPEKVSLFTELGIDAVTLANNHALDFGEDALLDSCQALDEAGILHTGAGADLEAAKKAVSFELGGKKISIIGATRVIPKADWAAGARHAGMLATYDPAVLLEEIRRLSAEQDYVIVFIHWGIEREEKPQEYQRTLAKQYIDAGADLVIGSHPHVLQGVESYRGKPIVYSLGNFIFGSSIPRTMLLEVTLSQETAGKQESVVTGNTSAPTGREPVGQETDKKETDKKETEQQETDAGRGQKERTDAKLRLIAGTSGGGYTRMLTEPAALGEFYRYLESISFGVTYGEDGTVTLQP